MILLEKNSMKNLNNSILGFLYEVLKHTQYLFVKILFKVFPFDNEISHFG